jgi:redox-sensing transcriptional repressor
MSARPIPASTVARLPAYRQVLLESLGDGQRLIASRELASAVGLHPDQVRRDLSYLMTAGTRGRGYPVAPLVDELSRLLGLTGDLPVVLVGAGNLGRALAAYEGFASQGFDLVAVLDVDEDIVGTEVGGLKVGHLRTLARVVKARSVAMGVVTVPARAAQDVVDAMVAAGLEAILNFAPVHVRVPAGVAVRRVDLSTELQMLSFHRARTGATSTTAGTRDPAGQAERSSV